MSKKLIAVAAAAALALTGLVGLAPANAAVGVQFFDGGVSNGAKSVDVLRGGAAAITQAAAYTKNVPFNNTLKFNEVAGTGVVSSTVSRDSSLLKIVVEVPNVNTTVSASATGAVRFIDGFEKAGGLRATDSDTGTLLLAKDGVATFSKATVSTGKVVTFYVYTTSTAADAFTISYPGFSTTYYLKGINGVAYNLDVTVPTNIATTGDGSKMVVKVSDIFGNNIADLSSGDSGGVVTGSFTKAGLGGGTTSFHVLGAAGAAVTGAVDNAVNYVTADGGFAYNVRSTAGGGAAITVTLSAAATAGTAVANVTGLPTAKSSFFSAVSSADLSVTVAALTTQVAALQVIVDRKVSKKRYNKLARKWNRANPSAKVNLKK